MLWAAQTKFHSPPSCCGDKNILQACTNICCCTRNTRDDTSKITPTLYNYNYLKYKWYFSHDNSMKDLVFSRILNIYIYIYSKTLSTASILLSREHVCDYHFLSRMLELPEPEPGTQNGSDRTRLSSLHTITSPQWKLIISALIKPDEQKQPETAALLQSKCDVTSTSWWWLTERWQSRYQEVTCSDSL